MILALLCAAAPTTGTPAQRAFAHQEAAFGHLRDGRHCEAVAELAAAYELDGNAGHLFNRAMAIAQWPGHCTEAVAAFVRFLEVVPTGPDADDARAKKAEVSKGCPEEAAPIRVHIVPPEPEESTPVGPWIAGGVAVLGAAAGGTFLAFTLDDHEAIETWQAKGRAEMTERYRGREDEARADFDRDQTLAWVGFGVAGAALSTALTLWLWPDP